MVRLSSPLNKPPGLSLKRPKKSSKRPKLNFNLKDSETVNWLSWTSLWTTISANSRWRINFWKKNHRKSFPMPMIESPTSKLNWKIQKAMFITLPTIWPPWNNPKRICWKRLKIMIWATFQPTKQSKNSKNKSNSSKREIATQNLKSRPRQQTLLNLH